MVDNVVKKINISYPHHFINLRDEAHRFGIKYFRKNFARYSKRSDLDNIEGIGIKRRKLLLKHFKTIEGIKNASVEDLDLVLKNRSISKKIFEYFKSP